MSYGLDNPNGLIAVIAFHVVLLGFYIAVGTRWVMHRDDLATKVILTLGWLYCIALCSWYSSLNGWGWVLLGVLAALWLVCFVYALTGWIGRFIKGGRPHAFLVLPALLFAPAIFNFMQYGWEAAARAAQREGPDVTYATINSHYPFWVGTGFLAICASFIAYHVVLIVIDKNKKLEIITAVANILGTGFAAFGWALLHAEW
jgi:hypothetical protein